jgi:hypothetical protein
MLRKSQVPAESGVEILPDAPRAQHACRSLPAGVLFLFALLAGRRGILSRNGQVQSVPGGYSKPL